MLVRHWFITFAVSLSIFILSGISHSSTAYAALDINKANAADLDGLKGVGPSTSSRILDERKKGEFKDWDDFISRVKGISAKKAANLSKQGLTVNDQAFSGSTTASKKSAKKDKRKNKKEKQDSDAQKQTSD